MPGSTGPDINTYQIPEVGTNDTFAYWRDASNTANYKLNKLRVYDAVDTASIGVTYTSAGVWSATLVPTILSGHTFTSLVRFTSGLTASGIYASSGSTFGAGVWIGGGLTASALYVSTGSTFGGGVWIGGGVTVGAIYASSGSTFGGGVWITGGVTASAVYASTGSTFAANLRVGSDSVGATLGVCGGIMLHAASPLRFGAATSGRWVAFQGPSTVGTNYTWTLPSADGASGQVLCTNGSGGLSWGNQAADVAVGNNTEIQYNASGGFSASSALTLTAGGLSASAVYASRGSTFAANLRVGSDSVGATLGVCGGIMLHSASPLRFGVTTSNRWVAFQAPNSVAANLTWTLPSADGAAGQVLCTNGSGGLSWSNHCSLYAAGDAYQIQYHDGASVSGLSASSNFTIPDCNTLMIGNMRIRQFGAASKNSFAIGQNALEYYQFAPTDSIFIGACAGYSLGSSVNDVTVIGAHAYQGGTGGRLCSTGGDVVVGAYAMQNTCCSSTTSRSVAFGGMAMRNIHCGSDITAIGACALHGISNSRASSTVAIGYCALGGWSGGSNSTGNIGIGAGAMAGASAHGYYNTAIGYNAMYWLNGGACNTAIGASAGSLLASSAYNNATAIGYDSQFYASNTVKLGNTASNVALTGSVVNNSDCRNKTDVRPTIWGLDFINALRPVDYRWDHRSDYADGTPDGSKKGTRFHSGLLAQEVQAAADATGEDFAGVIHWSHNGISQGPEEFGLKYDYFVAPLIRAVQELSVRVCAEEFRRKE
jgi:Chaperone of endosialidase